MASPYLWCEVPPGHVAADLARDARREGLLLAPGEMFSRSGGFRQHLRLNVANALHPQLLSFLSGSLGVRGVAGE